MGAVVGTRGRRQRQDKFAAGAYLAIGAMVVIYFLMRAIRRHYDLVAAELVPKVSGVTLPSRNHAVVLVSKLHAPTLRALAYAKATRPDDLTALMVAVDEEESQQLQSEWDDRDVSVPLRIIASPYREITRPVLDYVSASTGTAPATSSPCTSPNTSSDTGGSSCCTINPPYA